MCHGRPRHHRQRGHGGARHRPRRRGRHSHFHHDDRRDEALNTVIAVDLGGTKIAAAEVTPSGVGARIRVPTPAHEGPMAILDAVAQAVVTLGVPFDAVGVGSAGSIDATTGVVASATDALTGWTGTDIRSGLALRLGLPLDRVVVENDVHAHGRGEAQRGAGVSARSMLMIAVGTGVGAAFTVDGEPWRGGRGSAGAIGHLPIPDAAHMPCSCGSRGHLEAIASGPAIAAAWREMGGADLSGPQIAALAQTDPRARQVLERAGAGLGVAIAALVAALDPDVVVVGGGLTDPAAPVWWHSMTSAARAAIVTGQHDLPILPATLGSDAALIGAGLRAHALETS